MKCGDLLWGQRVFLMSKELKIITHLVESLEESANTLESGLFKKKGVLEAYLRGRVQGIRDCISTIKQLFYLDR